MEEKRMVDENELKVDDCYMKFLSLLSVDGGIHRTERVLMLDSIEDMVICYVNESDSGCEIQPMSRLKEVFQEHNTRGTEKHRYQYHGGEHGVINGFFSFTDNFVYIYTENDHRKIASVSSYNLAHFFCDLLDTSEKCMAFSDWVGGNVFWKDVLKGAIGAKESKSL